MSRLLFLMFLLVGLGPSATWAQDKTCADVLQCPGSVAVGAFPDCRCATCAMDGGCVFPEVPSGDYPNCACRREPVKKGPEFDPCQAGCKAGVGTGTWPDCKCEPSNTCNPLGCPFGYEMTGSPPLCECDLPRTRPPE